MAHDACARPDSGFSLFSLFLCSPTEENLDQNPSFFFFFANLLIGILRNPRGNIAPITKDSFFSSPFCMNVRGFGARLLEMLLGNPVRQFWHLISIKTHGAVYPCRFWRELRSRCFSPAVVEWKDPDHNRIYNVDFFLFYSFLQVKQNGTYSGFIVWRNACGSRANATFPRCSNMNLLPNKCLKVQWFLWPVLKNVA